MWIELALVAILAGLTAALVLWRARRRRVPQPRLRPPRYPVLLLHGLFGFDQLRLGSLKRDYFHRIGRRLERLGCEVHRPRLENRPIVDRAAQLVRAVDRIGAPRLNIIAHSMGGLDARYAIARLGLESKVACLITVGTPHQGTPLADLGHELSAGKIGRVMEMFGVDPRVFADLSTRKMKDFNLIIEDTPGVAYASVVGHAQSVARLHPLLLPAHLYLAELAGGNDGLVPTTSQKWGEVVATVDADHWAQIGWSRHFDALSLYEQLMRELRGRGF
jgi:triacylglycerol lipase